MMQKLGPDDVMYCTMPLFHSNAIITSFGPWLISGSTLALRRRFSASGFLPDVRNYGVTYFNYVGKPLSYILATPAATRRRRQHRSLGSSATKAPTSTSSASAHASGAWSATATAPPKAAPTSTARPTCPRAHSGSAAEGTAIIDAETGEECPPARFDEQGHLLNPDEAIGEIVNKQGRQVVRGLLQERRGQRRARTARVVLDRRSRISRRERLLLLRRPGLRVAARRRRELCGRARRTHPCPSSRRRPCRGVRRPRRRGRRSGHGRAAAATRRDVRSGRLRRVLERAARPRHEVVAALRPDHRRVAGDRDAEDPQARAAP